jgi:hypothetical protein
VSSCLIPIADSERRFFQVSGVLNCCIPSHKYLIIEWVYSFLRLFLHSYKSYLEIMLFLQIYLNVQGTQMQNATLLRGIQKFNKTHLNLLQGFGSDFIYWLVERSAILIFIQSYRIELHLQTFSRQLIFD